MSQLAHLFFAGLLLGQLTPSQVEASQTIPPDRVLPTITKIADVEVRLAYESHGGCVGRCIKYQVIIRGDGLVQYQDLGGEPRDPSQQRRIAGEDVVALVNEFVRERFFEASASYDSEPTAVRDGDSIRFSRRGGVDGPEWDLTLRLGPQVKTVHLYMGFPTSLARLRDLVDSIGGPKAWKGK